MVYVYCNCFMFLYTTNELQIVGFNHYSLLLIYFVSIVLAISVIVVKSPVVSILYLIGLFCTVAVYLVMSGMIFAGLVYLLVYVGAISILFIFIVMLLNVRISELLTEGRNSTVLGILAIFSMGFIFSKPLPEGPYNIFNLSDSIFNIFSDKSFSTSVKYNDISIAAVSTKSWDNSLAEISHMASVGNILYNSFFIDLIIVSFIILLAMVGAIVITVKSITRVSENESNMNISTN